MLRQLSYIFFMAVFAAEGYTQTNTNITIVEDPAIAAQVSRFVSDNKAKPYIPGWRVQILTTTDKLKLDQTLASFKTQYPYMPVTWVHERPYYLLRAGACLNRLDALRLQQLLRPSFPGLYPVQDAQINPVEFIGSGQ
jgi:hypothetical protein